MMEISSILSILMIFVCLLFAVRGCMRREIHQYLSGGNKTTPSPLSRSMGWKAARRVWITHAGRSSSASQIYIYSSAHHQLKKKVLGDESLNAHAAFSMECSSRWRLFPHASTTRQVFAEGSRVFAFLSTKKRLRTEQTRFAFKTTQIRLSIAIFSP